MRARYYDPTTGQFLTVDPLVAQTQQAYAYGDDDPVNEIDPSGELSCGDLGPFSGACSTVTGAASTVGNGIGSAAGAAWSWTKTAASNTASWVGTAVSNHYGQIAEGLAGAGCIAGLQPELCIAATVLATGASEYQNFSSSCPSVAGGLIDLLGAAPGLQVAGADYFGLLGAGRTAGNVLSGIVGGGAIVGGPAAVRLAEQQDGATQSSCGCQ